jgi:MinD superfamily P-loop ATPase
MIYEITGDCICCGACQSECPVEAITEGDELYVIDGEMCNGCGICVPSCPVEAIVEVR